MKKKTAMSRDFAATVKDFFPVARRAFAVRVSL